MIRSKTTSFKSLVKPIICASALFVLTPTANAQSGTPLPQSTVEAISINSSQRTQINEFVQGWTQRALSDKPQDNKNALESLTAPLNARGVSVAFRQAYVSAITPLMDELDAKGTVGASLSSLRLAGDLATPAAATRIRNAFSSDDLGVQLFAVSRAGKAFRTTKKLGPAMTPSDAASLVSALKDLATSDNINPELLRACVRALSAGTTLSSKDMGNTRSQAIIALADAVAPHLQMLDINSDPSFAQSLAIEAAGAATASISDFSSDTNSDAVRAAVGLGGDIISVSLRRVLGKTMEPVADRDVTIRSVQAGETLLFFALRKDAELDKKFRGSVTQTTFAQQLTDGDDKAFRNGASVLLAAGSPLVDGFKFQADRFLR